MTYKEYCEQRFDKSYLKFNKEEIHRYYTDDNLQEDYYEKERRR